jgi:S-methylmethionine-dependent homocysteine/selenocysteine methylase
MSRQPREAGGLGARLRAAGARSERPLLLDGAMGTELERAGLDTGLPLWSARALLEAPEVVASIHRAYVAAGADLLTANTFRTHARSLAHAGHAGRAAELTARAVTLAREAAADAGRPIAVLGSAAPLEDCYRPDRVPGADALAREHAAHAGHLALAGVDAVLVETQNTIREALAAAGAARDAGAEVLVSFVCGPDARLLSDEPLGEALAALEPLAPAAVGVNCLPPADAEACLEALAGCGLPFAVYANLGAPDPTRGFAPDAEWPPERFAACAATWLAAGAAAIGGCCGTRPSHTRALRALLTPP